jgi:hypothetical protein
VLHWKHRWLLCRRCWQSLRTMVSPSVTCTFIHHFVVQVCIPFVIQVCVDSTKSAWKALKESALWKALKQGVLTLGDGLWKALKQCVLTLRDGLRKALKQGVLTLGSILKHWCSILGAAVRATFEATVWAVQMTLCSLPCQSAPLVVSCLQSLAQLVCSLLAHLLIELPRYFCRAVVRLTMVGASIHSIGAVRRRLPPLRQRWRRLTLTRLSRYARGSVTTAADEARRTRFSAGASVRRMGRSISADFTIVCAAC